MRLTKHVFIFLLPALLSSPALAFNRDSIHTERIGGIDLSLRADLLPEGQRQAALSADGVDLVISESVAPATFCQDHASVIALSDESWLVAWSDIRMGAQKIFWQLLDSLGNPAGSNQLVASSVQGADYVDPRLSVDTLGRVYLFYRDRSNGMVFGSRYDGDFSVSLAPFLINDTSFDSFAGPYEYAIYPDGKAVVVWENYSVLGSTIAMRLYDENGNPTYGPTTVNSDGGSSSHRVPSVAVDPAGDFLVCWEDYRNGRADMYARLFNGGGNPLGSDFTIVPPPHNGSAQYAPEVAFSVADKFVIGWIDRREGQEVYIQRYSASTGLIGDNVLLSGPDTTTWNWNLDLTVAPDDKLLACWAAFGPENKILRLRFDSGVVPVGSPVTSNLALTGRRWEPSAAYNVHDRLGISWTEFTGSNADVHFMLFEGAGGALLGSEVKLNDDSVGAVSSDPFVVPSTDWYNLVVFVDQRHDAGDIYCQTVSNSGNRYSANRKVNQDIGSNLQSEPSAAVSMTQSKSLVVWVDSRDVDGVPGHRIFGRWGTELGVFHEDDFIISDSSQTAVKGSPTAVIDAIGRGLVAWCDNRHGSPHVFGRWLVADGTFDGDEFSISDPATDSSCIAPTVSLDSLGRFYVIWLNKGLSPPAVKVEWYFSNGSPGGGFSWPSTVAGVNIDEVSAAVNDSGHVSILWTGTGMTKKLYMTRLKDDGAVLAGPFEVVGNPYARPSDPALAIGNNNYHSAVWVDRRSGLRTVYYRIYDDDLQPVGGDLPVSDAVPELMISPSTSAFNGRAWFTWVDSRADGLNVYATNAVYLPTYVEDDDGPILPTSYRLSQNYPNPFNPSTEIRFSLPERSAVALSIYNMLGQKVAMLAEGHYPAGEYTVDWDGTTDAGEKVASGLYFYRLQAGSYAETRKMVLLK